jgi:hypothetical protein
MTMEIHLLQDELKAYFHDFTRSNYKHNLTK